MMVGLQGSGKTTTTANLAAAMARNGMAPLAIDLDPQAHLTTLSGLKPRVERTTTRPVSAHREDRVSAPPAAKPTAPAEVASIPAPPPRQEPRLPLRPR